MRWRISLLVVACAGTIGCARTVWVHPDYTPALFNKDSYECERDARQSGYFGTGIAGAINMQSFFDRCMVARGWEKRRQSGRTPVEDVDTVCSRGADGKVVCE